MTDTGMGEVLHVRLSGTMAARLSACARAQGVKPSEAVRMALVAWCERAEQIESRRLRLARQRAEAEAEVEPEGGGEQG